MKSALAIIAGLLVGVLVAAGILAAFVLVGPDPVGLRPTPSPSAAPSIAPSPSPSPSASVAPSASASAGPSGSAGLPSSPNASEASQAGFHAGAPPLVLDQLGGGTFALANLEGEPVWAAPPSRPEPGLVRNAIHRCLPAPTGGCIRAPTP